MRGGREGVSTVRERQGDRGNKKERGRGERVKPGNERDSKKYL